MKVLAIDTTNYVLGIALVDEGNVIGEYITNLKKNHSVRAMPAIDRLLSDCDVTPQQLDKIVVATGPGSYTGVRIGVSIAKTMAWSLKIPIVGVSSLEVLAANGRYFNGFISPIFDARRGQVYTGLYQYANGGLVTIKNDQNLLLADWLKILEDKKERVLFVGNDVVIHKETIVSTLGDMGEFGQVTLNNPRPSELGLIGLTKEASDVHSLVPNYIRLAEAEAKWLEQQK
ncbi:MULTISPECIES: tRNA (adenosine(37)-N6)-threonylcarbamoyltransferase complex dimerization subunit type 1 TsaB [Metabacillus]|uniref:tRNA threonylcarbamoyladenosine biosynthesis protein TsaB n=3 Tax=Metabacillus TaxID=2675233 RepID=A0A179SV06_9BACI|nr:MULTISPECIES: tRNA (adenosine(37)-N6)-threonylcarbamoyltransferase complex dimerization subunit type 1 TsaB [Metabacillus]OAS84689.1 tRNA threonylcarbamoyladenosine biosynthesis protein TsaB [Metabacillus litoralis]QNF27911.1 tRNA (adenosine(37)-N6)-threonylcarbamoyltransferase complex dimerization subunit type 1 TsaB [Metabacillus sp. KUDC1714]